MKEIKFKTNWNKKIDCDCFTTIRLESSYYQIGDVYRVIVKDEHKKNIVIKGIRKIKLSEVNEYISHLDTGYSVKPFIDLIKKMYSKKNINWETQVLYFILCVTVK